MSHQDNDGIFNRITFRFVATPLGVGLVALINQQLAESISHINPWLYEQLILEADVVQAIVTSTNGDTRLVWDWDPYTGWGSPNDVN